jgi:4-aminobutyrate aminotransferase/(S)-3-amino-2-methylpropionate transaminase
MPVRRRVGPVITFSRGTLTRDAPSEVAVLDTGRMEAGTGGPSLPQELRLVTEIPGPRSRELLARREAAVAGGLSILLPVFATRAGGGVLVDADGNSLIDFGSGLAVTNVGNSAPEVVEAVAEQVARFTHACFMITPYEGYVEVCEALNALTPGDHPKRSALFNSGAEAVENAVKIARAHTGREAVVVFDHAYHGRTNLTMAMTAKNMPYKHRFGPFAPGVYRAPMAYPFRWPTGPDRCAEEAAAEVVDVVTTQVGADQVACVVVEPILGEGGFVVPAEGFLPRIAEFCRANGIVLIADEIQTGFCRTGDWFACEHEGLVPDMVTTAKGIAGGLPLAAVTGRAEIMASVHVGGLGGTYGGNPVACAAALATMRAMREHDLAGRARHIGEVMLPRLRELAARHPAIGDVRGRGAMLAVELVEPGAASGPGPGGTRTPDPAATKAVAAACHARGLIVLTAGTYGNVLRFLPPLVLPDHLMTEGLDILGEAFSEVLAP